MYIQIHTEQALNSPQLRGNNEGTEKLPRKQLQSKLKHINEQQSPSPYKHKAMFCERIYVDKRSY